MQPVFLSLSQKQFTLLTMDPIRIVLLTFIEAKLEN